MNRKDFLVLYSHLYYVQIVYCDCNQIDVEFSMNSVLRSRNGKIGLEKKFTVCLYVRSYFSSYKLEKLTGPIFKKFIRAKINKRKVVLSESWLNG